MYFHKLKLNINLKKYGEKCGFELQSVLDKVQLMHSTE